MTGYDFNAVWGSSSQDVWVAGGTWLGTDGVILHYDGNTWTLWDGVTGTSLHGVWGSSAGDVWAVGKGGTILHH
jgi:hypothetical protein